MDSVLPSRSSNWTIHRSVDPFIGGKPPNPSLVKREREIPADVQGCCCGATGGPPDDALPICPFPDPVPLDPLPAP